MEGREGRSLSSTCGQTVGTLSCGNRPGHLSGPPGSGHGGGEDEGRPRRPRVWGEPGRRMQMVMGKILEGALRMGGAQRSFWAGRQASC